MTDPDHLAAFRSLVQDIREGMLVTEDPSLPGLRSRPMSTSKVDDDGNLWFFTKMTSAKVQEIYHDRDVNVAYQKPGDNKYVSASGKASLVDDPGLKKELYSPLLDAWFDGPGGSPGDTPEGRRHRGRVLGRQRLEDRELRQDRGRRCFGR